MGGLCHKNLSLYVFILLHTVLLCIKTDDKALFLFFLLFYEGWGIISYLTL